MSCIRLGFISILGEPGSYNPSVYDDIGGDNECYWFREAFKDHLVDVEISCSRVSHGEPVPEPNEADCFILGGSYNSVHDDYHWQRALYIWFDKLRSTQIPLLGICGGHQLMCNYLGVEVGHLEEKPLAGTLPVNLTAKGRDCPLFANVSEHPAFHFANSEHVLTTPANCELLATHPLIPNAALSYGDNWYSTQFHPEATVGTISRCWRKTHPELTETYSDDNDGRRVMENFVDFSRAAYKGRTE